MANAFDSYKQSMNTAINSYNKAMDQGLQSAKLGYDAQKQQAAAQQRKANTSAQQAQLQAVNPYGYSQQNLASMGLRNSGISESSRISAGNTYQQALSAARDSYDQTAREADLAYNQAVLNTAAEKGKYAADANQNIASTGMNYNQWAQDYALKQKQLEDQIATNKISREQAAAELEVYRKWAMKQAEADYKKTLKGLA